MTDPYIYIYIYIYIIDPFPVKKLPFIHRISYLVGSSSIKSGTHGVMVKAMDCGIVVREFVLQLRYYVHFRANTLGKGMNPLILPAMG